jgi:hypothetical protein
MGVFNHLRSDGLSELDGTTVIGGIFRFREEGSPTFQLPNLDGDPIAWPDGQPLHGGEVYYNHDTGKYRGYNAVTDAWVALDSSGGGGGGDVVGPGSSTDNAVVRWNGTGGDTVQDSGIIVDDSDNISGVGNITLSGTVDGVDVSAHAADSTIHFTEGSIDHTAIQNIGSNTHSQIDTHIADSTIHFTEGSIDHGSIGGLGDDDHALYLLKSGLREWDEQAGDPTTPASTKWALYFKATGLHYIDDGGVVTGPLGNGTVIGPGSVTDRSVVLWDGTGGTAIQDSGVIVDVSDNITGVAGLTVSGDITTSETASRALQTDGSSKIEASSVTTTELGHLSGVTSAIQTQFGTKVTGPASATDEAIARFDGTTGKLIQNSGVRITDLNAIQASAGDASTTVLTITGTTSQTADLQQWKNVGGSVVANVSAAGKVFGTGLDAGGQQVTNLPVIPSAITDATSKRYVDGGDAGGSSGIVTVTDTGIMVGGLIEFEVAVQAPATQYEVLIKNKEYTKTSTQTIAFSDTDGLWYGYFDANGDLQASQTEPDFNEVAMAGIWYWDATNTKHLILIDNRHGREIFSGIYNKLRKCEGPSYCDGLGISGYTLTGDGTADADAQLDIASGSIFNEDLEIGIVDDPTPSDEFEQDLSPAKIPILYKSGSTPLWREKTTVDTFPLIAGAEIAATQCVYNEFTGGSWQLTECTSGAYFAIWIFATADVEHPIIGILGEAEYTGTNSFRVVKETEQLRNVTWTGLPKDEFRPIFRLIFETQSGYSNIPKAALRDVRDMRGLMGNTIESGISHSSLDDLDADDHLQYVYEQVNANPQIPRTNTIAGYTYAATSSKEVPCLKIDLSDSHATCGGLYILAHTTGDSTKEDLVRIFDNSGNVYFKIQSASTDASRGLAVSKYARIGGENGGQATQVPLTVRGNIAQSANLQEWQTVAALTWSYVTSAGKGFFQGLDATGSLITNVLDPISLQDAATKNYVDTVTADFVDGPVSSTDHALVRWDGTSGDTIQDSGWVLDDAGFMDIPEIAAPGAPGADTIRLYAVDQNDRTVLEFDTPSGQSLRVCRDNTFIAKIDEAGGILKGEVVYISGAVGVNEQIKKWISDGSIANDLVGVALEDGANNDFIHVQSSGKIRGLDTSSFTVGVRVYASATVAGEITDVEPIHPNLRAEIGTVSISHALVGEIIVAPLVVRGDFEGTRRNEWKIGDDTAGSKDVVLRNGFDLTLRANPTADRTVTIPDATGTIALTSQLDHGGLTGLSDDDHSIYLVLVPGSTARNKIVAGTSAIGLTIAGASSTRIQEWRTSADAVIGYVDSAGKIFITGADARSSKITSVADPTDAQDAVTKTYSDNHIHSITISGARSVHTNIPAAITEVGLGLRIKINLTNYTLVRFTWNIVANAAAGGIGYLQYSTDESSWSTLTSNSITLSSATGTYNTAFESIPAGARGEIYIRAVTSGGNGSDDPQFGTIAAIFKRA